MSRKQIVAGNWKMNLNLEQGINLVSEIISNDLEDNQHVIVCPPYTHLSALSTLALNQKNFDVAAQNCHQELSGAYTGEISVEMLTSIGIKYVLIGHSERRQYFNENHQLLAAKVATALSAGMIPIFCFGEHLEIREAETHVAFVKTQLQESIFQLSADDFSKLILAYEPVWAIGTGKTASPQQAQDMHREVRNMIAEQYDDNTAQSTTILYGGSVKSTNAKELFGQPDVDGGLVGGASLTADNFIPIIRAI